VLIPYFETLTFYAAYEVMQLTKLCRKKPQVKLQDKEGLVFKTFDSKNQCAEFLGISTHTVSKRKITNSPVIYKNQEYFII
jgi:uncharacterized protein YqhQ